MSYEASLKQRRDAESVYNSAMRAGEAIGEARGQARGKAEGERKKAIETALNLKAMDIPVDKIAKATGLTLEEVEKLK